MPENKDEEVVVIETVIPELDGILGANAGLLSAETFAELQAVRESKINAAKEFIKESKGTLFAEKSAAEEGAEEKDVVIEETPEEKTAREEKENKETPEEKTAREAVEAAKKAKPAEKIELKENSFGIKLNKGKADKSDLTISKAEDIIPAIEKLYGQKLKDLTELPKHFEAVNKWRADAQKFGEAEKEAKNYKGLLEGLAPELLADVKAFYAGQDYKALRANQPSFDFTKAVEKQDMGELVSHYFKNKFTAEQLATIGKDEQDPAIEIAVLSSKDKYTVEKEKRDAQIVAYDNQAKEKVRLFTTSVDASVGYLKQSFPDVSPAAESAVKQTLSGGPNAIVQLFCNPDGSYKPGAAEMLLLAQEGKSVMTELMAAAERAAETRVNEEIVNRGADGSNRKSSNGASTKISPEAQQKIDNLTKLKKPVHF